MTTLASDPRPSLSVSLRVCFSDQLSLVGRNHSAFCIFILQYNAKSNSNKFIFSFSFSLSHYIGKFSFSISTYIEEVLRHIDFPLFLYGKGDAMSPLSIGIGEKLLGIEKK